MRLNLVMCSALFETPYANKRPFPPTKNNSRKKRIIKKNYTKKLKKKNNTKKNKKRTIQKNNTKKEQYKRKNKKNPQWPAYHLCHLFIDDDCFIFTLKCMIFFKKKKIVFNYNWQSR